MKTPRRGFLKGLAAAPLLPAALAPQASPPAPKPAPVGPESVAEALAEAVKREFGEHLDAAELEAVRKELRRGRERAERLCRAARLTNADGPVNRFEARPPQAAGAGGSR
jgi:hypothetical protein